GGRYGECMAALYEERRCGVGEIGGAVSGGGGVGGRNFLRAVRGEKEVVDRARKDLAADLAGRAAAGVDVQIEIAGEELGDVGGSHAGPCRFDRTGRIVEIECDGAVDARCAAVDVRDGCAVDVVRADY